MSSARFFKLMFPSFVFLAAFFSLGLTGHATPHSQGLNEPAVNIAAATEGKVVPAEVTGFRSAKFGMDPAEVRKKIAKDFGIKDTKSVAQQTNPIEKTESLLVAVDDIIPESGKSQIGYVFGYKSKKLVQINILWGIPVDAEIGMDRVVATANILRRHFAAQGFDKENVLMNVPLSQGSIIVFRGTDSKGRMALLDLNILNVPVKESKEGEEQETIQRASLKLSYILSPTSPDVFTLDPGEF